MEKEINMAVGCVIGSHIGNGEKQKVIAVLRDIEQKVERYEKALKEINKISTYYDNRGWALNADVILEIVKEALDPTGK